MKAEPISFEELEGWAADDHEAALIAFLASASRMPKSEIDTGFPSLVDHASQARSDARNFFESSFAAYRVASTGNGLLTGYFEPELAASRVRTPQFPVPLHARPDDLVTVIPESERGSVAAGVKTHLRRTGAGLEPMPTRRQIDEGALYGCCRELFFVADEIDRFVIQVQGSGALRLATGGLVRVSYDGKNGHAYTSIGRLLIERGEISSPEMSLARLVEWLKSDIERARLTIWSNESYVFFRELEEANASTPVGVLGTALIPGRSLAIDPSFNKLGCPIFIESPEETSIANGPLRRLMIAHDVGSAIKGPERGDIFLGTGDAAGLVAGSIKHPVRFTVLVPKRTEQ